MSEPDLRERYPDLRPLGEPPSLRTVNGVGTQLFGSRDVDSETGACLKTLCLSVFHVPLVALGAYRVVRSEKGGWYFLGREPLSLPAKIWNAFLLLAIVASVSGIFYQGFRNSPNVVANRKMSDASQCLERGEFNEAVALLKEVINGRSDHRDDARGALLSLHQSSGLDEAPLSTVADVLGVELSVASGEERADVAQHVYEFGLRLIDERGLEDLEGSIHLIRVIAPLVDDELKFAVAVQPVLERLVGSGSADVDAVVRLAMIYESKGNLDRCREILEPVKTKLGDSEGARILGQILAAEGDGNEALDLLDAYCSPRLQVLSQLAVQYEELYESGRLQAITLLKRGRAEESFYQEYQESDERHRSAMVERYVADQLKVDKELIAMEGQLTAQTAVVPVAFELALIRVGRADSAKSDAAKQTERRKAGEILNVIEPFASEVDGYQAAIERIRAGISDAAGH